MPLPTLSTFDTIFDDFPYKEYIELDNYPKEDRVRQDLSLPVYKIILI